MVEGRERSGGGGGGCGGLGFGRYDAVLESLLVF